MSLELLADRHADEAAELQSIRYNELVEEYMLELDISRHAAEVLVESEIGANPDAYWGPIF